MKAILFLFIDEAGFNNEDTPRKTWKLPNEENFIKNYGWLKSVKLIIANHEFRTIFFELNKCTTNRYVFLDFLKNLIEKIKNDFELAKNF